METNEEYTIDNQKKKWTKIDLENRFLVREFYKMDSSITISSRSCVRAIFIIFKFRFILFFLLLM